MTDLPENLIKEAFCRFCFEKVTRNIYCERSKDNKHCWALPAEAVAKELERIRKAVKNSVIDILKKHCTVLQRNGNVIEAARILKKELKKVDEAFK